MSHRPSPILATHLALPCLLLSALLPAQYSRAKSDIDKVRSARSYLDLDKDRADQLSRAKTLNEACDYLRNSLAECGKELADFGSNFRDERAKPRSAAATVRGQAEALQSALKYWMAKLDSTDNHKTEGEKVLAQADELIKQWTELERRIEETRRWLADGQKSATQERDRTMQDCRPIEDAQNAAWARLQAAQRADDRADAEHDRALERVLTAETKENETYERYKDAAARGAKSEEVWALRQQWSQAANEENDALGAAYNALQSHQSAREELKSAYAQLGSAQRDMRAFAAANNADKIVENFNYFVRWNELFDKEFK